jgi:hypothetical protein
MDLGSQDKKEWQVFSFRTLRPKSADSLKKAAQTSPQNP